MRPENLSVHSFSVSIQHYAYKREDAQKIFIEVNEDSKWNIQENNQKYLGWKLNLL